MSKFKSRKFWLAVVGAALIVANEGLGLNLPSEEVMTVAGVLIAYIIGESIVDANRN